MTPTTEPHRLVDEQLVVHLEQHCFWFEVCFAMNQEKNLIGLECASHSFLPQVPASWLRRA